jgi:hypothetical protein
MTKFKILSAIVILSAAIAAPVFAHEESVPRARHAQVYDQSNFRGAYNQSDAEFYAQPLSSKERRNVEDFFDSNGRDHIWCSWADCIPPWAHSAHGG